MSRLDSQLEHLEELARNWSREYESAQHKWQVDELRRKIIDELHSLYVDLLLHRDDD